jgi:hypothetical protein
MKKMLLFLLCWTSLFSYEEGVPLFEALRDSNLTKVQKQIENGADIHQKDKYTGSTLLHIAAMNPNSKILQYVLTFDLDINTLDFNGASVLDYAVRFTALQGKGTENMKQVLNHKDGTKHINTLYNGYTLLMIARNNFEVAKLLIEHGADLKIKNPMGYTALDMLMKEPRMATGNPDMKLIRLLGGDENTKPFVEPATMKVKGKLWEYKTEKMIREGRKTYDQALRYCENLHLDNNDFRVPECKEIDMLSSEHKTDSFVHNGIPNNGVYINFVKTPDLDPYSAYWCLDDTNKTAQYKFSNKKVTTIPNPKRWNIGIVKCIRK